MLTLHEVTNGAQASPTARSLEPVVHKRGQVDIVSKLALSTLELPLFILTRQETHPSTHCLFLQEVVPQELALLELGLPDLIARPMSFQDAENA